MQKRHVMALVEKNPYMKIGRPRNFCIHCEAAIDHAGKHPSILKKGPAEGITDDPDAPHREDYCADCWQQISESDYMGFWVTRREPPKPRKIETKKERNAALLAWFELLNSQPQDEETRQSLFFLAHLLMKYGVFKWQRTDSAEGNPEKIIFRQAGTEEDIEVEAVDFSDERSLEIKRELDEFMEQYANSQPAASESDDVNNDAEAEIED